MQSACLERGAVSCSAGLAVAVNARVADGITGVFLGLQQLGFLKLGWRFFDAIAQISGPPVSSVALSSFSKLRDNSDNVKRATLDRPNLWRLHHCPLSSALARRRYLRASGFGEMWLPSVAVLQLLGLHAAGDDQLFLCAVDGSTGHDLIVLKQSVAQIFINALFLGVGARWGVEGVVIAILAPRHAGQLVQPLRHESGAETQAAVGYPGSLPPSIASAAMVGVVWLPNISELRPILASICSRF